MVFSHSDIQLVESFSPHLFTLTLHTSLNIFDTISKVAFFKPFQTMALLRSIITPLRSFPGLCSRKPAQEATAIRTMSYTFASPSFRSSPFSYFFFPFFCADGWSFRDTLAVFILSPAKIRCDWLCLEVDDRFLLDADIAPHCDMFR